MNIFEIDSKISEILESAIDPETGEILDEELFAELDALQESREKKIENAALLRKNKLALITALKAEKQSIDQRIKSAQNIADHVEKYLETVLQGKKFSTPKVAISWRKTQAVKVNDISLIPKEYLKFKEPEANKAEIGKVLKSGGTVAGTELVTNTSLVLK